MYNNKNYKLNIIGFAIIFLSIAIISSNLLLMITNEYPNMGIGSYQQITFRIDSEVYVNTKEPTRFISGYLSYIPDIGLSWLQMTGKMVTENDGTYTILISRHAGVLTTIGLNYIEDQLGDSAGAEADYISLTTSASAPTNAWTIIPSEIVSGTGLDRAQGTYASTGNGVWTITKQFTASGTHTAVQCAGFNWASSGDNNLLCADTFTSTTLISGDKLTVIGTFTVS